MARRISQILKERNIGFETFIDSLPKLGFDLDLNVNSKFSEEDEMYLRELDNTDYAIQIRQYIRDIMSRKAMIKSLEKEIDSIETEINDLHAKLPVKHEKIEEANQIEKIILFSRYMHNLNDDQKKILKLIYGDLSKIKFSESVLELLQGWDKSMHNINYILRYGRNEDCLKDYEKPIFYYKFIEAELAGKLSKKFRINCPDLVYSAYSSENYQKLIKWYHSSARNFRVQFVNPCTSDVDAETAIMSMLKNGGGDEIGY